MKINLKPMVEMTNEEKETLRAFADNFTEACKSFCDCNDCLLNGIRDAGGICECGDFMNNIFRALGIN